MSTLEREVQNLKEMLAGEDSSRLFWQSQPKDAANARAGLILESEAKAALGSPELPTARFLLYSSEELPGGDQVSLIGEDLEALPAEPVPFAEAVILHGPRVTSEIYYQFIQRHQRLLDQPGFMLKTSKNRLMARVSEEGMEKGFAGISSTFIARIHEAFPEVQAAEIFWITCRPELAGKLAAQADASDETITALKAGVWEARGFDYKSCQLAGHCGECGDKKTCASVRQMEAKVKMKRRREAASEAAAAAA